MDVRKLSLGAVFLAVISTMGYARSPSDHLVSEVWSGWPVEPFEVLADVERCLSERSCPRNPCSPIAKQLDWVGEYCRAIVARSAGWKHATETRELKRALRALIKQYPSPQHLQQRKELRWAIANPYENQRLRDALAKERRDYVVWRSMRDTGYLLESPSPERKRTELDHASAGAFFQTKSHSAGDERCTFVVSNLPLSVGTEVRIRVSALNEPRAGLLRIGLYNASLGGVRTQQRYVLGDRSELSVGQIVTVFIEHAGHYGLVVESGRECVSSVYVSGDDGHDVVKFSDAVKLDIKTESPRF
jgi:hypothetical protein